MHDWDGGADPLGQPAHASGDDWFEPVEERGAQAYGGRFEVAHGAFDGAGGRGGFNRGVLEAQVEDRLVEFLGRDLTVGHRVPEVAGVRAHLQQCLLDLAGSSGDRVAQLVPVLRGQLSLACGLGEDHGDALVRVGRASRDRVQVAGGLGQPVVVLDAVRGQLRCGVADVGEIVDGLVGIVLCAFGEPVDGRGVQSGELERASELLRAVRRFDDLSAQAGEHADDVARDGLGDTADDADLAGQSGGEPGAEHGALLSADLVGGVAERLGDGVADAFEAGHDGDVRLRELVSLGLRHVVTRLRWS